MIGRVESYLLQRIREQGSVHITLLDPEEVTTASAFNIAKKARDSGTSAIMVGGSTFVSQAHLDAVLKAIKRAVTVPTILFPNNVTGISRYADAIWFMSLLNSVDPYFIIGAQILGAPLVKKFGLEPIPMGYIIVGDGGTAGIIGKAIPVPYNKPELVVAHALAGQYLGMRFIYLEGGSGAKDPVPPEMISIVKKYVDIPIIVGGGIRTKEQSSIAVSSGADMIVTGNVTEGTDAQQRISDIIHSITRNKK
jgi:phosphoglycerol geranylgeranyltransferase